jgi:hypothetical protein
VLVSASNPTNILSVYTVRQRVRTVEQQPFFWCYQGGRTPTGWPHTARLSQQHVDTIKPQPLLASPVGSIKPCREPTLGPPALLLTVYVNNVSYALLAGPLEHKPHFWHRECQRARPCSRIQHAQQGAVSPAQHISRGFMRDGACGSSGGAAAATTAAARALEGQPPHSVAAGAAAWSKCYLAAGHSQS